MNNSIFSWMKHLSCMALILSVAVAWADPIAAQQFTFVQDKTEQENKQYESDTKAKNIYVYGQPLDGVASGNAKTAEGLYRLALTESIARQADENAIDESLISNYWIGVRCEKAEQTGYSPKESPNTELTINGGMKVLAVTEGSASDKAGLEEGDVLLRLDEKKVNSLNDLYAAIGEIEDNESDVILIRSGELVSLKITPQERPDETSAANVAANSINLWTVDEAIRNELANKQVPEGYRIQIELVRGKDVSLKVIKGDETWQADNNTIKDLPEPVQGLAETIVTNCKPMVAKRADMAVWTELAYNRALPARQLPPLSLQFRQTDRLDAIQQQLAELTKVVEKLKSKIDD